MDSLIDVLFFVLIAFLLVILGFMMGSVRYQVGQTDMLNGKAYYQYVTTEDGEKRLVNTNEYKVECLAITENK